MFGNNTTLVGACANKLSTLKETEIIWKGINLKMNVSNSKVKLGYTGDTFK